MWISQFFLELIAGVVMTAIVALLMIFRLPELKQVRPYALPFLPSFLPFFLPPSLPPSPSFLPSFLPFLSFLGCLGKKETPRLRTGLRGWGWGRGVHGRS